MTIETLFGGFNWNHTMVKSDKLTSRTDTGSYEGCTGSLPRNESDVAIFFIVEVCNETLVKNLSRERRTRV